jgi:hypothetical protein
VGNGNKAEMLIAVCAVISSIAAVYIAWDQARVMRSQEKADVWPMIQLTHQTNVEAGETSYTFDIKNAGVGPALIDDYIIMVPGEGWTKDFKSMVRYLLPESIGEPGWANTSLDGRVLRQGDGVMAVRGIWAPSERVRSAMQERIDEYVSGERGAAEVFVCYCSILDDCWVSTTLTSHLRPEPVKSCGDLELTAQKLMPVGRIITPEEVPTP